MWSAGGWKLYLAGPDAVVKPVAKAYTKKGARAFDYDFFTSIYGRPVEAVVVPLKAMPETNESPKAVKTDPKLGRQASSPLSSWASPAATCELL